MLKVEAPSAEYLDGRFSSVGLAFEDGGAKSAPVECNASQNFSRPEVECDWTGAAVKVEGWPVVVGPERPEGQRKGHFKRGQNHL